MRRPDLRTAFGALPSLVRLQNANTRVVVETGWHLVATPPAWTTRRELSKAHVHGHATPVRRRLTIGDLPKAAHLAASIVNL